MNTIAGSISILLAAVILSGIALAADVGRLDASAGAAVQAADDEWLPEAPDPTVVIVRAVLDDGEP